jgi:hypothetical protein
MGGIGRDEGSRPIEELVPPATGVGVARAALERRGADKVGEDEAGVPDAVPRTACSRWRAKVFCRRAVSLCSTSLKNAMVLTPASRIVFTQLAASSDVFVERW